MFSKVTDAGDEGQNISLKRQKRENVKQNRVLSTGAVTLVDCPLREYTRQNKLLKISAVKYT